MIHLSSFELNLLGPKGRNHQAKTSWIAILAHPGRYIGPTVSEVPGLYFQDIPVRSPGHPKLAALTGAAAETSQVPDGGTLEFRILASQLHWLCHYNAWQTMIYTVSISIIQFLFATFCHYQYVNPFEFKNSAAHALHTKLPLYRPWMSPDSPCLRWTEIQASHWPSLHWQQCITVQNNNWPTCISYSNIFKQCLT